MKGMKLRNRDGREVTCVMSNQEAAAAFAEKYGEDSDNWLWYYIHESVSPKPYEAAGQFLQDWFVLARGYGLKYPKVRVHYICERFKLYLSRKGTLCLQAGDLEFPTMKPQGDRKYIGCFFRDGSFRKADGHTLSPVQESFLKGLAEEPTNFLARCSKDMSQCCYCGIQLETAESLAVGYGPVCAAHWGLPWGRQMVGKKVPSFAEAYDRDAHTLAEAVRQNPDDPLAWDAFGDWLESKGLQRCDPNREAQLQEAADVA